MTQMFRLADAFNQDISGWEVSNVTDMSLIFYQNAAFDQSLGTWDISQVANLTNALSHSAISRPNYDATLTGWAALPSLQQNVQLDAHGLTFCTSTDARNHLTSTYGWTIANDNPDCSAVVPFITTWKTDNAGTSSNTQITIPTFSGETYNYSVTWEEVWGPSNTGSAGPFTGDATIDFPSSGTYRVSILGQFPRIYFNNGGDKEKILKIDQWGDNVWLSMESAFDGCTNVIDGGSRCTRPDQRDGYGPNVYKCE